jgi:hypothetical protein
MGEASQEKSGVDAPHFDIIEFGSHFVIRVERFSGLLACKQDAPNEPRRRREAARRSLHHPA